ncbi:MAG: glucosamine inositolphosphorylceramide transferase family protein [Ginsengibacter sp.]
MFGPYRPHPKNPVRDNINGSRPAGSFILVDGNIYRPAQNSGNYYGSSIAITKIVLLNETEFIEENYMTLVPNKKDNFNFAMHTINYHDNLIVVDGLRRTFSPLTQIITFTKKKKLKQLNN